MNQHNYYQEIRNLAESIVEEAMQQAENDQDEAQEMIDDHLLHESIDSHQWVIYYGYNDDVIEHSDNDEAYRDIYDNESIGQIVKEKGLEDLKTIIAFWAMYYDTQEAINTLFEEME